MAFSLISASGRTRVVLSVSSVTFIAVAVCHWVSVAVFAGRQADSVNLGPPDRVPQPERIPRPMSPRCEVCNRIFRGMRPCNRCGLAICHLCFQRGHRCLCHQPDNVKDQPQAAEAYQPQAAEADPSPVRISFAPTQAAEEPLYTCNKLHNNMLAHLKNLLLVFKFANFT